MAGFAHRMLVGLLVLVSMQLSDAYILKPGLKHVELTNEIPREMHDRGTDASIHGLQSLKVEENANSLLRVALKLGAKQFVRLVYYTGLYEVFRLQTIGNFTIFLPTDAAFKKMGKWFLPYLYINRPAAKAVVLYHATRGAITNDTFNEELVQSLYSKAKLRFNTYPKEDVQTVSGSAIVRANIPASNGYIHTIDRVISSIPVIPMVYVISKCPIFSTLWKAVLVANLTDALGNSPLTLFAPTNRAFSRLPAGVLDKLLKNPAKLKSILEYHVLGKTLYSAGVGKKEQNFTTLSGKEIEIVVNNGGKVAVGNAVVVRADTSVTNGVIHVINNVLLPGNASDVIRITPFEESTSIDEGTRRRNWLKILPSYHRENSINHLNLL